METLHVKADRQTTSLLDISIWSNVAIILLLAVANFVNYMRVSAGSGPLFTFAAPELVLIASIALILWLGYACIGFLGTKRRLRRVSVTLDENGVSGYALERPSESETGENFSIPYGKIRYVGVVDVAITKKQNASSLKIATAEREYIVPAPEKLQELVNRIAERMPDKQTE